MTNTPKTAESSVAQVTDNAAEKTAGRRVRILSARSAGLLALVLAAVVFAIDQGTKYLVVTQMQLGERITVIDGLLWWYSIRNSGAAFSMGENVTWVFTLVMVVAAAVVLLSSAFLSPAGALSAGVSSAGACTRVPLRFRPLKFSSTMNAMHTQIAESAILKIAKFGTEIKSTT